MDKFRQGGEGEEDRFLEPAGQGIMGRWSIVLNTYTVSSTTCSQKRVTIVPGLFLSANGDMWLHMVAIALRHFCRSITQRTMIGKHRLRCRQNSNQRSPNGCETPLTSTR